MTLTHKERALEVTASACGKPDCRMCNDYIENGDAVLRPATRDAYLAGLARSYPNGIPTELLPRWAGVR